jgi:superoxide dismutase, Fe-Mn family
VTDAGTRHCSQSVRAQFDFVLGGVVMRYHLKQIYCRPWTLSGFSLKLIESHYENNYGGALRRLNAITEQLESLDFAKAPGYVINGLKREELAALNSTLLHELYFASMGGDGRVTKGMSEALVRDFGSVQRWRTEFSAMGYALSGGSGWVLLTWLPRDGRLINQYAAEHSQAVVSGIPVLALDMYEHAYALDFGAKAAPYVDIFMRNVHWERIEARYGHALDPDLPGPPWPNPDVPKITAGELHAMLGRGGDVTLVDVCRAEDVERRHDMIAGARFLLSEAIDRWASELPRDKTMVTYCMYGFQGSSEATIELRRRGLDARALAGGIAAWRAMGWPTVPITPASTEGEAA